MLLAGAVVGLSAHIGRADATAFTLEGTYSYGHVDGYVQTPDGGDPGTTSHNRPTLSELGIDHASVYGGRALADWGPHQFFLGGQYTDLSGSATLDQTLITHRETFPAGTHVSSDVKLTLLQLGYGYKFDLGHNLAIRPMADFAILDFDYEIKGGGISTSRKYPKGTFQLGGEFSWRPNDGPFELAAGALLTPPISSVPAIDQEWLMARYRVFDTDKVDGKIGAGVRWEQDRFEDKQTVPNRFKIDMGPMFVVEFDLSF
jgi:hypothetical protein